MHEELRSHWECAKGQHKWRTCAFRRSFLNGSKTVTCYLLSKEEEEEEAGRAGGAGKLASCCFLGEVRRTPSGDLKLSLLPLLNALSLQADSHAPATSPGRFRKSLCLSKSLLLSPFGRIRHTDSPWSFPVPSSYPGETPKCQKKNKKQKTKKNFELHGTGAAVIGRGRPSMPVTLCYLLGSISPFFLSKYLGLERSTNSCQSRDAATAPASD